MKSLKSRNSRFPVILAALLLFNSCAIFGKVNDSPLNAPINTKTIFQDKKIGPGLVTLKVERRGNRFYRIDCLSCFIKIVRDSRKGFLRFYENEFYNADIKIEGHREDTLTIVIASQETVNRMNNFYPPPSTDSVLGLYYSDMDSKNPKNFNVIYIGVKDGERVFKCYNPNRLDTLLHELGHYYFDIYGFDVAIRNQTQDDDACSDNDHCYIERYIKFLLLRGIIRPVF